MKFLGAILFSILAFTSAFAADLSYPTKTKRQIVGSSEPLISVYGGVFAGYGWSHQQRSLSGNDALASALITAGFVGHGSDASADGGLGGLRAGVNWQFAPKFVIGAEVSGALARLRGTDHGSGLLAGLRSTTEVNALIDVIARLGWIMPNNQTMVYGLVGWSFANAKFSDELTGLVCLGLTCRGGTNSAWVSGWALGGGVEHVLGAGWSVDARYTWRQFGDRDVVSCASTGGFSTCGTTRAGLEVNTLTIGVNKRF